MLSQKMSRVPSLLTRMTSRAFSNQSVTYDFKDLIIDPEQKKDPIYHLHHLDQA